MKTVLLPSGERVPAFGQGTWNIGDNRTTRAGEIATLCLDLGLGATLIDTAKMYSIAGVRPHGAPLNGRSLPKHRNAHAERFEDKLNLAANA